MSESNLDDLVRAFTSFLSWEEMKDELDRGFIPVVVNPFFKATLESLGYKTWDGLSPR